MTRLIIIVVSVITSLLLAALIAAPFLMMPWFLGKRYEQEQHLSADYGIESERITLKTDDGLNVAAWRTRAAQSSGTVIILSGIERPSVTAFFGYAKMLADNGWDALLIEMRARSESEGEEIGFGLTEWLDVKAGVDFLTQDEAVNDLPIVAMGTSMGGGVVITAAGELPEIDAVISLSAFSSITDLIVDYIASSGVPRFLALLDVPFINEYLGFHFGFDKLKYSPLNGIAKLGERPVLMMHSTEDSQVPYSEFESLLAQAEKNDVNVTTFIREGNIHFICYDTFFNNPAEDTEFSEAVLTFLAGINA